MFTEADIKVGLDSKATLYVYVHMHSLCLTHTYIYIYIFICVMYNALCEYKGEEGNYLLPFYYYYCYYSIASNTMYCLLKYIYI